VFRSPRGEKPIEVNALAHALRNNDHLGLPHFTPHDLRRTCSDWMARLKVDGRARSAVLNHKEAGVTEQHYTAYTFDDEKKRALDRWARELKEILTGKKAGKVVSIG
jgi:integrase